MPRGRSPAWRSATLIGFLAVLGSLSPACASDSPPGPPRSSVGEAPTAANPSLVTYPGTEWRRADPREAGFDPAKLDKIAAEAQKNGSNCLVVIRHGKLVADWYWNGTSVTSQEVFSATKSYSSTLIGIAQAAGELDVDDKVSKYVSSWAGTPSENVRIKNILSNDSGRHWDPTTDYRDLLRAANRTRFAVELDQDAAPGRTWVYNNAAIQTLDAVLKKATGKNPADYAKERLFGPIGMSHSQMTRDSAGNTNMFFGFHSTCQDMARFGYLFLRGGAWTGTQIVPARWVKEATGRPSQTLNAAYGYLWWLNNRGPVVANPLQASSRQQSAKAPRRRLVEGAPKEMYWALGLGGQIIQIDPGSDTVVVRLGRGDARSKYGPAHTAKLVTQALVRP
ncbi:serine hydrolase domain-containing protein [Sphaerisporangium perillae]|uniref:serine hydrolase domain-containing protein n=1 Tax=Sphaerisporangium perillae TaxID=2935860 RepID=UPI00200CD3A4|nr:serine hydrolase domain-containing protein [Sphaerisporangium perillae]